MLCSCKSDSEIALLYLKYQPTTIFVSQTKGTKEQNSTLILERYIFRNDRGIYYVNFNNNPNTTSNIISGKWILDEDTLTLYTGIVAEYNLQNFHYYNNNINSQIYKKFVVTNGQLKEIKISDQRTEYKEIYTDKTNVKLNRVVFILKKKRR